MKKLFVGIVMVMTLAFGLGGLAFVGHANAASPTQAAKAQVCQGVSGQTGGVCGTGGVDINKVIQATLNIMSIIAGLTAVIMIIISGLKYITSSGDAQAVSSAKRTLIYAIVGLIVVAFAQFIVRFVLTRAK